MMLALVIALQVLDLGLTLYAFSKGFHEGNPVLRKLQGLLGRDGAIIVVKVAFIALLLYFRAETPTYLLAVFAGLYIWVCWHNLRVIKGA